jgi:predicted nucleotidyltransferase
MARTALEMTEDELRQYRPFSRKRPIDEDRFRQAWQVARQAASLLYATFGVQKVSVFGSLLHLERFAAWSDIDLAVWGIRPEKFFKAAAKIIDLSPEFEIDLVDAESCSERMKHTIEKEGVIL